MYFSGWEDGGAGWRWRRRLWVWEEEMLGECIILLHNVCLQINVKDTWKWHMHTSAGYTVRSAYQLLTTQDTSQVEGADALVWHKHVPLKVSIFAWRLVKNRLPTRANLVYRDILSNAVAGCNYVGAAISRHLSIYSSLVVSMVPCGFRFDLGLVCQVQTPLTYQIISINLLIQQVADEQNALLCNLFG